MSVTKETHFSLKNLTANTNYTVQIQYVTSHGDGTRSDPTVFRTDEECKYSDQVGSFSIILSLSSASTGQQSSSSSSNDDRRSNRLGFTRSECL